MKTAPQPPPLTPEQLKPALHSKIERMNEQQLVLLSKIILQLEAEELLDRLGTAFDQDHTQGILGRVPELVRQFRAQHRYA